MKKLICLVLAVMLALSAVSAFAAEYTDKDTVKKVQQALNDAGYECGTPDGIAGIKTYAAITSYQTDKGLTVTGVIDDELLAALGLAEEKEAPAETGEETPAEISEEVDEGLPHIVFRGAEFGATLAETIGTLGDDFFENSYPDGVPITTNDIGVYTADGGDFLYDVDVRDKFVSYWATDSLEVAGYESGLTYLYFIKPANEAVMPDSIENSVFYGATYIIPGSSDIESDLIDKLTGLYGNSEQRTISFVIRGQYKEEAKERVWRGANSVEISLYRNQNLESINLSYVWREADNMVEAVFNNSPSIEVASPEGNTNGL